MMALLQEVAEKHRPSLLHLVAKFTAGSLAQDERQALIDAITAEFCATGLRPGSEPNERGLRLESLLDSLNKT
jgi:hypothetical protein